MNSSTFRAAYWTNGSNDVLLTTEDMAGMLDSELLAEASRVAEETGLEVGEGRIVIGEYTAN